MSGPTMRATIVADCGLHPEELEELNAIATGDVVDSHLQTPENGW
jgi:hypothetical protein